jgi:hypothetical protein
MEPPCVHLFEIGIFITVEWALKNGTKNKTGRSRRESHNASKTKRFDRRCLRCGSGEGQKGCLQELRAAKERRNSLGV